MLRLTSALQPAAADAAKRSELVVPTGLAQGPLYVGLAKVLHLKALFLTLGT